MATPAPDQALVRLYAQAAARLRAQIRQALESGAIGTATYRQRQLDAVQRELRALGQRTRALAPHAALQPYLRGVQLADRGLTLIGEPAKAAFSFTGTHPGAVDVVARNFARRLQDAAQLVGRRTEDAFREAALQEIGTGVAAGATRREVSAALERRLIDTHVTDALTGFVDARGARWQLDTYTEMVARTTTREVMTKGTRARLEEVGHDLVTISSHANPCEICADYDGQTYSLSGDSPDYDALPEEPPFHPNCLHVMTPGGGDLTANINELANSYA